MLGMASTAYGQDKEGTDSAKTKSAAAPAGKKKEGPVFKGDHDLVIGTFGVGLLTTQQFLVYDSASSTTTRTVPNNR